jgi:hypothetical protein
MHDVFVFRVLLKYFPQSLQKYVCTPLLTDFLITESEPHRVHFLCFFKHENNHLCFYGSTVA